MAGSAFQWDSACAVGVGGERGGPSVAPQEAHGAGGLPVRGDQALDAGKPGSGRWADPVRAQAVVRPVLLVDVSVPVLRRRVSGSCRRAWRGCD